MQVYVLYWSKQHGHFSKCSLVYLSWTTRTLEKQNKNIKKLKKKNINCCLSVLVGLMSTLTYYNQINRSKSWTDWYFLNVSVFINHPASVWGNQTLVNDNTSCWTFLIYLLYHKSLWLGFTCSPTETDSGLGLVVWSVSEFDW